MNKKLVTKFPRTNVKVDLAKDEIYLITVASKVRNALNKAGHNELAMDYIKEAVSHTYNLTVEAYRKHLLAVTSEYVKVTLV